MPDGTTFFATVNDEIENLLNGRSVVAAEVEIEGDQMTIIGGWARL